MNRSSDEPVLAELRCDLDFEVEDRATLAIQIAAAAPPEHRRFEQLSAHLDGVPLVLDEVSLEPGAERVHLVRCGPGELTVRYRAGVSVESVTPREVTLHDSIVGLRQSRYCQADRLQGFATAEFGSAPVGADLAALVADWVHDRLEYSPGASGPLDTAVDTLLAGSGVCRDYAHLTIALCRALGMPARFVAAYAPGLAQMDFHAVAEVAVDGRWAVFDATRLAPRSTLVRIATGRDAADTAFCDTIDGRAELVASAVNAVTNAPLPIDSHHDVVGIA